ncbi:MAG: response regulator [Methylocystaceae bacterium]|nr:response regulator [Methylocystaceae bacterium]
MADILLVEDNPDDAELALQALRRNDLKTEVFVAKDGQGALDYLFSAASVTGTSPHNLPLLILLDLNLPYIGGLDVLKKIRSSEITRHVPVVILTTSDDEYAIRSAYELGANSLIKKSTDFDQFVQAMRQINDYWLGFNIAKEHDKVFV